MLTINRLQKEGQGDESSICLQLAGLNRSAQYTRSIFIVKDYLALHHHIAAYVALCFSCV